MEEDNLIRTEKLTLADVPAPDADLQVIEAFCLTFDGYDADRFSSDDLLSLAESVERQGLELVSLDDLRRTAFIRQREYRWSTDQGQEDPPLEAKIRDIVAEIRRRLEP